MAGTIEVIEEMDRMLAVGCRDPFGPQFAEGEVRRADRLVLVKSGFSDPGPDWIDWTLYAANEPIATKKVEGY